MRQSCRCHPGPRFRRRHHRNLGRGTWTWSFSGHSKPAVAATSCCSMLTSLKSSATIIVFAYYFVALSHNPALYNRWAVLALESVGTLLWLASLALLAGWTARHRGGPPSGYGFWHAPFGPSAVGLQGFPKSKSRKYGIAFAGTAAGLSGLELYVQTRDVFNIGPLKKLTLSIAHSSS
jgi:hypothetical protein